MQTQQIVDEILHRLPQLESYRSPYEPAWREIDERVNPLGQGGFNSVSPGAVRGLDILDHTASLGLDRFTAAYTGMIIPRGERYHQLSTTSSALNEVPAVQAWLELANDRLFAMRYAPSAGFDPEANMNIRSLGSYGSAPFWIDHWPGRGLYYKTFHLSEIYVDEDFRGRIDTVYRKFQITARQAQQMFPDEMLTPKMREAVDKEKFDQQFWVLHVVRPRKDRDPQRLDFRRLAWESRYISIDDRAQIRESGYSSMPMAFSRYVTAPRERYGRSPAMQVLGNIRTTNEMMRTLLRAGHKAVDPPLLLPEDGVLTQLQTKPGGLNVGGMGFDGTPRVGVMPQGNNFPIGMELLNNEREPIRDAFLEKVWSLVLERRDRMTATEVLELTRMQGMLLAPMASRQETEWLGPQIERELDIGLQVGFIPPMPQEMLEEGASVRAVYDNPLSRAAKAEEAIGFGRWVEMLAPIAAFAPDVYDVIDTDRAPRELAKSLAVRQSYLATPDAVAEKRAAREEENAAAQGLGALKTASEAVKNLSSARGEETAFGI